MEADETKGSAESAQKDAKEQEQGNTQATEEHQNVGQGQRQARTSRTRARTYKQKERMLEALTKLKGANITQAAQLAGVGRQRHYEWLKADPKYRERAESTFQELIDTLESVAYSMAMEKNPQVLLATLKAKAKDRGWGEDPHALVQVNQGIHLEIIDPRESDGKPNKKNPMEAYKKAD